MVTQKNQHGEPSTLGAKILLWSGVGGFLFSCLGVWFAERHAPYLINHLWVALLAFLGALALGLANFAWIFLRHPIFPPHARTVPKKYYGIALALLALLGVGLIL